MPDKPIKKVKGAVTYDVKVDCPHCNEVCHLNQYPFTDEEQDYSPYEDELGMQLFGTPKKPAVWSDFEIEYQCCHCKKEFVLEELEY